MLNTIPEIKKEFFAYRNGIVADMLRKNGDPHAFIMGCQLVDVQSIASRIAPSASMASAMWNDAKHRECRMIAPMLYPADEMTFDTAKDWALSVECNEIADVLCHRLLRHLACAQELAQYLASQADNQVKYTGFRLWLNLLLSNKVSDKAAIKDLVEKERVEQHHRDVAQLLDSISEEL